jgi:hypothetical protein
MSFNDLSDYALGYNAGYREAAKALQEMHRTALQQIAVALCITHPHAQLPEILHAINLLREQRHDMDNHNQKGNVESDAQGRHEDKSGLGHVEDSCSSLRTGERRFDWAGGEVPA